MAHWLIKTEPETYSFADLVKDGRTSWSGVRSYAARLHLSAMKKGDDCLVYHSVGPKEIVGTAEVVKEAYPDKGDPDDDRWVMVDVKPRQKLARAVTLAEVKAHPVLCKMELVRQSRLSVCPVSDEELRIVLDLAQSPAPR